MSAKVRFESRLDGMLTAFFSLDPGVQIAVKERMRITLVPLGTVGGKSRQVDRSCEKQYGFRRSPLYGK